jgi:dihydroflavonol-4-reductase
VSLPNNPKSRPSRRGTGDILVVGATGQLGREVCRLLGAADRKHRALVRPASDRERLTGTGVWMIEGDVLKPHTLIQPMDGIRVLVHLAAARGADHDLCRAVRVDGTGNLLEAACEAGVRRIINVSCDSVLRSTRDACAISCAGAEELLRRAAEEARIEVVVLRPPMLLGPHAGQLALLDRLSRLPLVAWSPDAGRRRPVWVTDVADAVLQAIDLPTDSLPRGVIDLPGPDPVTVDAMLRMVARLRGRREPRVVPVPVRLLRSAARTLNRVWADAPITESKIAKLQEEVFGDASLAEQLLDWQPLAVEETLSRSLAAMDR